MSSRDHILNSLREAQRPFPHIQPPASYLPMTPLADTSPGALRERFISEVQKLSGIVHQSPSPGAAIETILELLGDDKTTISWDAAQIPLPGLTEKLMAAGIQIAAPDDSAVRVGISGADAALAATGSLVVTSGTGKFRTASLLPPVHIAVITEEQILPDFESWVAIQRANDLQDWRRASNIVLISGPSRTADIAMQLILGMHGPRELHVILLCA